MALTDLCLWHYFLMGDIWFFKCDCGVEHPIASGASYPRSMVRKYFSNVEFSSQDSSGAIFCCGSAAGFFAGEFSDRCGEMVVCSRCKDKHVKAKNVKTKYDYDEDSSDSSDDVSTSTPATKSDKWDLYRSKFQERMNAGEYWMFSSWNNDAPRFPFHIPAGGILIVENAKTALKAGVYDIDHYEWWQWVAGWYDDCPAGIKKHM